MHHFKRVATLILAAGLCLSLLTGCAGKPAVDGIENKLSVCVGAAPVTLDPIYAEEIADQTVLAHLYENLMRVSVDENGVASVVGGMAKDVEVVENHDGTVTYTFKLRNAKWSDGEDVRAEDFVYAWQRLANPASQSPYAELLSEVVGYEDARATGEMKQMQVSAKNTSTLVVTLKGNYDWFLREVCTSPATMPLRQDVVIRLKEAAASKAIPKPWWSEVTELVTNGAYVVKDSGGAALALGLNAQYYEEQNGPSELTFCFANTAEKAQTLYEEEKVDAIWPLTETRLSELAAEEGWEAVPELKTYAVYFNCENEMVSDPAVRQAMSLVIDRNALALAAGITAKAAEGLVPPGVVENEEGDFRTIGGALLDNTPELYEERCAQAQQLLEDSGYDSGVNLGEMEYLYIEEGTNGAVAALLCQQWMDTLQIQVTPRGVTKQELWTLLRSGEYTLAGTNITAVGNDAECFLMGWTSGAPNNVVGYESSVYDTLMAIIASAPDGEARMGCLHDAEELLVEDYVLAPLYTKGTAWELRDTLLGGFRDSRGWFRFSNVIPKPEV